MKRFAAFAVALSMFLCLFGCAMTEESGIEATLAALKEAENVTVHIYRDGEKALLVENTEDICEMIEGEWKKAGGRDGGEKVLTVTVGTQHEITFFDNGRAMIYYGFTTVFEKDRCYYSVDLDSDLDSLYDYVEENGTVPETEE